jgi:hypothetical protein
MGQNKKLSIEEKRRINDRRSHIRQKEARNERRKEGEQHKS